MSQNIADFISGRPFGDGRDGDKTISANTTQSQTVQSCSGASGQKNLTIASGAFSNNDIVLIHQSRGTGVGGWEINKVASGGGTTTLVMQTNLTNTYTDSGASQAQVIKVPMYNSVTVDSGKTWAAPAWGGNTGGILVFAARGITTITGNISASQKGFRNGNGGSAPDGAKRGEGYAQGGGDGNSGDSGGSEANSAPGGGGGHATTGKNNGFGGEQTSGGKTSGSADLTIATPGGGAAGGNGSGAGHGGDGGGIIFMFTKNIAITGTAPNIGQNGTTDATGRGGGAGAGGATLIVCQIATLGTNKATATGGTGGTGNGDASQQGGAGGVGRIRCNYSASVSGTTNPTLSSAQDTTLVETDAAFLFNIV